MKLKITALHDVTVWAYVDGAEMRQIGSQVIEIPKQMAKWVRIRAGDVVTTGIVSGVYPDSLPDEFPTHINGVSMVLMPSYSQKDLPAEFFGLFNLSSVN